MGNPTVQKFSQISLAEPEKQPLKKWLSPIQVPRAT